VRYDGAPLDQIQLSLGHSLITKWALCAIQTTERYLGVDQDLTTAPVMCWGSDCELGCVGVGVCDFYAKLLSVRQSIAQFRLWCIHAKILVAPLQSRLD
jgi:hypothetical protein